MTTYIKQFEDIFLPPQPYTTDGFARRGRELRPPQFANLAQQPVMKQLHNDFIPLHKDFNRYYYNQLSGYVEKDITYPIYKSGFATNCL